ncbi:MAG: formylglycine-generating enzyme family protein [Planctomycetes bacterium]|nr:formylglycine-generating enzyme family protein [Planctomycetota bacterium]
MLTSLVFLALPIPAPAQTAGDANGVQGLVEIPAGRVQIGLSESEAKELINEHPNTAAQIGAQVGSHRPSLERFWIAPTEVTNEMYLRYVQDTGAMPPASWVQLDRDERLAIIDELKKDDPAAKLDANALGVWWEKNWESGEYKWGVLPEEATMPVGYISHEDARAFCVWAGLRLPTEEEWVRAARGDETDQFFPMGDFDAALVAHDATKPRELAFKALPVSALENASTFGLYDMAGNHWEWTDSRFESLPKFKPFTVRTKKAGKVNVAPDFDAAAFVLKGGSFQNPGHACSVHVRPGIQAWFRAPILGFRVASSGVPGRDYAAYHLDQISGALVGGLPSAVLDLDRVVAVDKHRVVPNSEFESRRGEPKKPLPASKLPDEYAVFDRGDTLAIVPMREVPVKKGRLARTIADEGPITIGALTSTVALESANALAGTYVMMYVSPQEAETLLELGITVPEEVMPKNWKPKKLKEDEVSIKEIWPKVEGLALAVDTPYVLLIDKERTAVSLIPLPREPRELRMRDANNSITFNLDKEFIDFQVAVPADGGKDAFLFNLQLKPRSAQGSLLQPTDWNEGPFAVIEKKDD